MEDRPMNYETLSNAELIGLLKDYKAEALRCADTAQKKDLLIEKLQVMLEDKRTEIERRGDAQEAQKRKIENLQVEIEELKGEVEHRIGVGLKDGTKVAKLRAEVKKLKEDNSRLKQEYDDMMTMSQTVQQMNAELQDELEMEKAANKILDNAMKKVKHDGSQETVEGSVAYDCSIPGEPKEIWRQHPKDTDALGEHLPTRKDVFNDPEPTHITISMEHYRMMVEEREFNRGVIAEHLEIIAKLLGDGN